MPAAMSTDKEAGGESFAALFEQGQREAPVRRHRAYRPGDSVRGVVVQVGKDAVFLELDGKRQAMIEAVELRLPDGSLPVSVGEELEARVVDASDKSGIVRLGRSLGRAGNLQALEQAKDAGLAVEGKVTGVNKGGIEVDLGGARGFCPLSHIDARGGTDPQSLVGQSLQFLVTEIKDGGKSVVVSRRALIQRENEESAGRRMADVVPGAVLKGTVSAVRDFGAFVDLGGVEGLLPRSEIGHDRSVAVADALKPGDAVEVQVREVKNEPPGPKGKGGRKITLSLKALMDDPWDGVTFKRGDVLAGTVTRVAEFGVFVRLLPAIEGLLHNAELGVKKGETAGRPEPGAPLVVVVQSIDREAKKIGLAPAPEGKAAGSRVDEVRIAVGAIVKGKVERIETYGIFVQLDGTKGRAGRGLAPVAELGVPRGTDLRKVFPEGTEVTAKVLETGDGKLKLSLRGAKQDEERAQFEEARSKVSAPRSLGTLGDLLKGFKR